ncbi:COG4315 family predicted lipoprotein [Arthrobacter humicola]|uniref:COG4315 family predicted lipoprotein n=1 Tax=Arthrobacter humicola TaxID=409291 RepID=UPI0031D4EC79
MKKHLSLGLTAFALAALLSGCGGASTTTSTSAAPAPSSSSAAASSAPASTSAADLTVAQSTAGAIVVGSKGLSVYSFTKDTKDSGTSTCTAGCATTWPPVTSTSATPTVDGVTGKVGTIPTADGKLQVTINGMPIYYYSKDQAAGDITGQGVGGAWYLVAPSGEMIKSAAGGY